MPNPIPGKRSKISIAAFVSAIVFLAYGIIVAAVLIFIAAIGGLECSREDFGACALQNLLAGFLEVFLTLVFILIIPGCLILTNGVLILIGLVQKHGKKDLLIASLVLNFLAVMVPLSLIGAFSMIFGTGN